MQKGGASESVSLSRTTCSSTTATPSPLKSLDWWDWEETKKQIQSKAASKSKSTNGRSSSRRQHQQPRSRQPVVLEGVQSVSETDASPVPVVIQRIANNNSDDPHLHSNCFESAVAAQQQTASTRTRLSNLAASSTHKRDTKLSLRKLLSFSSKMTSPSVNTMQSAPAAIASVHRLTWEDEDETPLSVGRKWNLAKLPRSTTPTPSACPRRLPLLDEHESIHTQAKKWGKSKMQSSTMSSTESEEFDDGQMSGSSSSKSKAQLRRNGALRKNFHNSNNRWFVRPESVMESKLEEEAASRLASHEVVEEAAKEAAKLARRKKGNSLIHAVFSSGPKYETSDEVPTMPN